jgi:CO/xanthine dehydrogenase Mo-binding subunit
MSRRQFFATLGKSSLVVAFSLSPVPAALLTSKAEAAALDSELAVDSWLAIDHQNTLTIYSGKVELGTGVETAFTQIVADELYMDIDDTEFVQGDTSLTPNQGFTAGSKSIQVQGPLLRRAAATAFQALLTLASQQLGVPVSQLVAEDGEIGVGAEMKRKKKYSALFAGQQMALITNPAAPLKAANLYTLVGQPVARLDLTEKCTGTFQYVSDIVVPGMLHGRVVRNGSGGFVSKRKNSTFNGFDAPSLAATQSIPGFVQVVQNGNFVGVVATTEWAAILAARTLKVNWINGAALPTSDQPTLQAALMAPGNTYQTSNEEVVGNTTTAFASAPTQLTATYYTPYQMHGSMGPACAIAQVNAAPDADGIQVTIWSGTQGPYPLRDAIAALVGVSSSAVRVIYAEGSGCYGHNGADDVAADAALMSAALGQPVRVQWMRTDEHGWEPLGPAMVHELKGGLDAANSIVSWEHTVYTPTHNRRPGGAGSLLAGQEIGLLPPALPNAPRNAGTRNAPVTYGFPNMKLIAKHVKVFQTDPGNLIAPNRAPAVPLVNTLPRPSALRSLGGMSNCFANESFMDELASAAGQDPIQFRKGYVRALTNSIPVPGVDARAVAVLEAVRQQSGWGNPLTPAPGGAAAGRGVAFARYETVETYVAAYVEVEVTTAAGPSRGAVKVRRVVVAHDCGLIINPDGLRNQIEGNVIQGISRALIEEASFNANGITSLLWSSQVPNPPPTTIYPVIHFDQVPSLIEIVLIDRPSQLTESPDTPAWGAGEPTIGTIPPAIANAIYDAVGARMRQLPITQARVVAALL